MLRDSMNNLVKDSNTGTHPTKIDQYASLYVSYASVVMMGETVRAVSAASMTKVRLDVLEGCHMGSVRPMPQLV